MWLPFTLLVLAGVVSAESNYGWKVGNEYSYVLQSRTFTNLAEFPKDYAGILMKGYLTVQAKEDGKLTAKLTKDQYAHVNSYLSMGWDEDILDLQLVPHDIPISEKPFDIKLKDGLIDSVIVEEDVPNWEVVLLKSIISQFQVDIKGKKLVEGHDVKVPDENDPRGGFTVLEDYFAGLNEVRYDFKPLSEQQLRTRPELVPKPELNGSGQHIDIVKTKSYDRYPEMSEKVFGMTRQMKKEPKTNKNLMSKSSTSRIVISGSLKDFVIQTAVSTSKMTITPSFNDAQNSTVLSKLSLTLTDMHEIKIPMSSPTKPKTTGYRISFETTPSSLEDPPKHPVWPNIIDYGGKFISYFREFNGLAAVSDLLYRISNELVDPNTIPEQQTLDKFTHLVNIIRTMNRNQIAEAENKLQISPKKLKWGDKADAIRQNRWFVFRDAITQAGTGPALLTIKNWVENGELRSAEAAEMLSKIPASARQITHQYTEAFFELATHPQVTQTALLNVTAITAFSELLFLSQGNDKSIYKFYPVHTTGRPSEEQYSDIVNKYIPYLGAQLKKAVDDGDSSRIQTHIVALGTIGMYEVLPVFEPFLTGREKMTAFQKTLILASLSNFVANHPKKALPGLKQIYMNTTESQEVRCMAVFLIPMTNPPLEVLREIVQFSNNESSKQVKSAVKSTLQGLEDLSDPEWQCLAKNAQAALKLLNSKDYDLLKSHQIIFNKMKEGNLFTNTLLNYIGSDNSPIPRTIYLASILYDGNFKGSPVELMTMIPNMDSLIDALIPSDKRPLVKMATEKIAEELNIVGDKPVLLEGNFLWRTKFLSRFIPYDENTIRNLPNEIAEYLAARKDGAFHNTHILNLYEMMIGDTTDTGVPFVYNLRECTLHKLSSTDDFKAGRFESHFQFAMVQKMQRDIGFVTPFDHRHFAVGVDNHMQVYVPLKTSVEVSAPKKSVQLKIWPPKSDEPDTVLLRMRTPYTSIHNIMDLQPLLELSSIGARRLHNDKVRRDSQPMPNTIFRMETDADASNEDVWARRSWSEFPMQDRQSEYHKVALIMDERHDEGEPLVLSASYGTLDVEAGIEDASQWTQLVNATEAFSENRDSEQRKIRFLEEAAKGIVLAQAGVLDFHIHIPLTKEEVKTNLTVAWSASNAETKGRFLSHLTIKNHLDDVEFEVCAASQLALTPPYFPVYDEVNNSTPKLEFDIDIRYGENCPEEKRVNIIGTGTRSNELREEFGDISVVKECKKQMEQGNKLLRACQKAGEKALQVDELQLSIRNLEQFSSDSIFSNIMGAILIKLQTEYMDVGKINLMNMESAKFNLPLQDINMVMNDVYLDFPEHSSKEKEHFKFLDNVIAILQKLLTEAMDESKINLTAKISKNMKAANISLQSPNINMVMNDFNSDFLEDSSEGKKNLTFLNTVAAILLKSQTKDMDEGAINLTANFAKNMKFANFSLQSPNINMVMNDVNLNFREDSSEGKENSVWSYTVAAMLLDIHTEDMDESVTVKISKNMKSGNFSLQLSSMNDVNLDFLECSLEENADLIFSGIMVTILYELRTEDMDEREINLMVKNSKNMKFANFSLQSPNINMVLNNVNMDFLKDSYGEEEDWISSGIMAAFLLGFQTADMDGSEINLTAKISKNMKSGNFSVQLPNINMETNNVNLDFLEDSSEEKEDEVDNSWPVDDDVSTCVMDLNRAETFDGKEFPLKLSSCWQVLMTTYPRLNPRKPSEKLAMSEDESVSILAREINGQKEVKVILGQNEILLLPGSELPEVLVNGQKVTVAGIVTHQVRQDDEVVFEIFQRGSHYISVVSEEYDVTLTYDGKRLMIEEPEMFSYSLRGLCGNYDGDSENDFMSPDNCPLTKPEEFIASYTLTKEQCEGENLQKVKSLQKAACATISRR